MVFSLCECARWLEAAADLFLHSTSPPLLLSRPCHLLDLALPLPHYAMRTTSSVAASLRADISRYMCQYTNTLTHTALKKKKARPVAVCRAEENCWDFVSADEQRV